MTFFDELEKRFPGRVERPAEVNDIEKGAFYVYVLTVDGQPIIIGHGRKNRARVIFDSEDSFTRNHIKAMTVRLHRLFAKNDTQFDRYLIRCSSKDEAKEIEAALHREFGGNTLKLPETIRADVFRDLEEDSLAGIAMRMALCSSFDGITDLIRWRRAGILGDSVWRQITDKLKLPYDV